MRHDHYILEGKTPVPVDLLTWAHWFETADRTIKKTQIGDVLVSTVFLGLNHNWVEDAPPLIFETMILGGDFDGEMRRHSTYAEAEAGHVRLVEKVVEDSTILDAEIIY